MSIHSNRPKTIYLLAWLGDKDGIPTAFFEPSTVTKFREGHIVKAGIVRNLQRVVAYCDHWHAADYLSKEELQSVAKAYLDEDYNVTNIDFRWTPQTKY